MHWMPKTCFGANYSKRMTRDDMLEVLTDTIFEGDEALVKLDTKTKSAITREWNKQHPSTTKITVEDDLEEESEED